jgi:hypothetical protein
MGKGVKVGSVIGKWERRQSLLHVVSGASRLKLGSLQDLKIEKSCTLFG